MTLNAVLTEGFQEAHRRGGAIVLDLVWKLIWLVVTGIAALLIVIWVNNELAALELNGPASAFQNPVALASLLRQLWDMYAAALFWIVAAFLSVSTFAWVLLEAYFRSGTLPGSTEGFFRSASRNFRIFLGSSLLKMFLIGVTALLFGLIVFARYLSVPVAEWQGLWQDSRAAFAVVCLVCLTLWFALTLIETLIRSDSLELFGRDLFLVVGVMVTLLAFEGMIFTSAVAVLISLMAMAAGPGGILLVVMAALTFTVILSVLHSYLLVVRFSTLDIAVRRLL